MQLISIYRACHTINPWLPWFIYYLYSDMVVRKPASYSDMEVHKPTSYSDMVVCKPALYSSWHVGTQTNLILWHGGTQTNLILWHGGMQTNIILWHGGMQTNLILWHGGTQHKTTCLNFLIIWWGEKAGYSCIACVRSIGGWFSMSPLPRFIQCCFSYTITITKTTTSAVFTYW